MWIHDYHLQLVPQMLRDKRPDVIIGFFFHIPFPPVELFMRLPWRTEIAAGLAGCDLVGFQRAINAANFVVVCDDLLGRAPKVGAYPISIDVEELEAVAAGRAIRQRSNRFRTRLGEPEVVLLGVDRLDYTKGISQRLHAYQALLADGTLDTERCVMVQVATPTREGVEHYQNERREIEQIVSEINGVYGRLGLPGDPLPLPVAAPRRARGAVPHGRRHARHAAARRHEPRRQGVRHDRASTVTACWCCRSSPAPPTS